MCTPHPINSDTSPVIRPRPILVAAQTNHGLDRKTHARLRIANRLVLGIMRHVWRAVEERVDAVATVSLDCAATARFGMLFNHVAVVAEERAWFGERDCLVETLAGGFDDADGVGVCAGLVANIVSLVQVAVEAVVVEGYVYVDNVAIFENGLVGYAVADHFVNGGADRFGKVAIVEG